MSTYDEFKNVMLTSESRKEIFGEDVHIDKDRKYIDPRKIKEELSVPFTGKEKEQTFVDAFKDNIIEEEKIKIKEPFFEQEEPKQDIYNEPQVKKPVVHNVPFHEFKNEEPDTYEPEIYQEKPITKTDDIKQNIRPEKVRQENIISKKIRQYIFPTASMFSKVNRDQHSKPTWLIEQEESINRTLEEFNVPGKVKNIVKGPTVTRHEIELEP